MQAKENFQISSFNFNLTKVAIVDDHTMVAEGFERIINGSGIAVVIGKAFSAAGCFTLLSKSEADILLLDVSLPDGNGIDLCRKVKALYPALKVIIITSHNELPIINRALEEGASGFILKNAQAEVIIEGLQTVASGERFLCDEVKTLLRRNDTNTVILSRREQELLRLIVEGKSTSEIAECLFLGFETIKSYRKRLMFKLNATNAADLVRIALEQKYL